MNRCFASLLVLGVAGGLVNSARADGPIAIHLAAEARKMTREVCAQKAVEVMGEKEKFAFAEVTPDGNARGWNDKVSVLVLSMPTPSKELNAITVIVASYDNAEAERIRNVLRAHVFEAPHNPDAPTRVGPEKGEKLPPAPLKMQWKSAPRPALNVVRHFDTVATLVLEKRGFVTSISGKNLIFGGMQDGMVAAFLSPTTSALSVQFNVLTVTQDEEAGAALADDVLRRVVRVLFDD
jgi:hypothetical protein